MQMTLRKILFAWSVLLLLYTDASAQTPPKLSGSFSNLKFDDFVKEVEALAPYHFYYNPIELDSLKVTVSANKLTVTDLLQKAFNNTLYNFAIDSSGNIFISKNYKIQTTLPRDFFERGKNPGDSSINADMVPTGEKISKEKFKASIENKLFEIGTRTNNPGGGKATIAGYIKDIKSGEPLAGASVYTDSPFVNTNTDQFGYYSLTLPAGRHELHINSFGMKQTKRQVMLYANGKLNVEMEQYIATLKDVIVTAEKTSNTRSIQMGVNRLSIQTIKQVPTLLGEADILKVVLTLPGVTSVGEASTGFNVRGGATDQNLILLNDATIYNPSHLFGFFSAFNPDVVKGVELYKSAIPEKYGGRLSSVLDVTTLDGNNKKFSGSGGIGPLTCKLTFEGPLVKDKSSFILGGRTTYSNWILRTLPNTAYENSKASFNDLTLRIAHTVNAKNNLYVTGYMSNDMFKLNSDTTYKYSNNNLNLKWKHNFSNRFYGILSGGIDNYKYENGSLSNPITGYKLSFNIRQLNLKTDFAFTPTPKHTISFGLNAIHYKLQPGTFQPQGEASLVTPDAVPTEQGLESALYLGDKYTITQKLSVTGGIRFSMFNYLGPQAVNVYAPGLPRDVTTITDTLQYSKGNFIKTYVGPEFRLALRYSVSENGAIKLSYNTLRQYIHMLSNTTAISPTDIWKLSDPYIKPQTGDQASIGYYLNFKSNTIETSVEVYYKRIKNYMDYKSGASLVLNDHIETDVFNTRGKAYGAEFMIKKNSGKLNGWISYTYSRTFLQVDDPLAGQKINNGDYYPANFDKPHNVNFIGNYRFSHRYSISLNVIYSTGRPITLPIAVYNLGGAQRVYYSDRNQYRVPDYFRTDLSVNIDGNHKIKKLAHSFWSFGVYNLTARKNVYSIYFIQENGLIKGYKLSIFGTAIPFVSYNFRF
jgi:hypothetical protein